MFTEYIFHDKKYELAVRDLKATLFDIVISEETKLGDVEKKASVEKNPERQLQLRNLCEQEGLCLKKVVAITDELSESLKTLDSYSRELEVFNNQVVAELLSNASLESSKVNENVTDTVEVTPMIQNQTNSIPQDLVEVSSVEDNPSNLDNRPSDEIASFLHSFRKGMRKTYDEKIQSEDDKIDEAVTVEEQPVVQQEKVEDSVVQEEVEASDSTLPEIAEATIMEEKPEDPVVQEEVEASDNTLSEIAENAISQDSVEESSIINDASEEIEAQESSLPVVDNSSITEESNYEEVKDSSNDYVLPVIDEENISDNEHTSEESEVTPEVAVPEAIFDNFVLPTIEEGAPIVSQFVRLSNDDPKAIITSSKQTNKLRESFGTQEALFHVHIDNHSDPSLAPVEHESPSLDDSSLSEIVDEVSEQQLVDNGLLEPSLEKKQNQIVTMTNEAQNLYKEGKIEEAQAMLEQVRVLNNELKSAEGNDDFSMAVAV